MYFTNCFFSRLGKMLVLGSMLRCGDALCTMAAQVLIKMTVRIYQLGVKKFAWQASTGTEFFVTDMTQGRLNRQQRAFSGSRFSDHVAALNAFQAWQNIREGPPHATEAFCDQKGLNAATLRTTADAKEQLRNLLVSEGFPEECFTPR